MITENEFKALRAIGNLTPEEVNIVQGYLDPEKWYISPTGEVAELNARRKYAPVSVEDDTEFRVLKRVSICRRTRAGLSFDQALEVVLAAENLHRSDQLRALADRIEELRADVASHYDKPKPPPRPKPPTLQASFTRLRGIVQVFRPELMKGLEGRLCAFAAVVWLGKEVGFRSVSITEPQIAATEELGDYILEDRDLPPPTG